MFDAVDPIAMSELANSECPGCGANFRPKRSNQKYCSPPCQKQASRNSSRGCRMTENRQRTELHNNRASTLTEMIYSVPPTERLGMMRYILSFVPNDAGLRSILTDPERLKAQPRPDNRLNISKAANAYTQKFFGLSIQTYVAAIQAGNEPDGIPLRNYTNST